MMNERKDLLRQLVREELYVVDESAVADAILIRSRARATVPGLRLCPAADRPAEVRSFRRQRGVRSFRLCGVT